MKMGPEDEAVISKIFAELRRAEVKFPGWPDDLVYGAAILAEEAGEVVKAAVDLFYGRGTRLDLVKEIAQTGAMAIRYLIYMSRKADS